MITKGTTIYRGEFKLVCMALNLRRIANMIRWA